MHFISSLSAQRRETSSQKMLWFKSKNASPVSISGFRDLAETLFKDGHLLAAL